MIEVFKTNVTERKIANMLIERIHAIFRHYRANFDLDDCDNILRVKSNKDEVQHASLISLLEEFGYNAEVLPD
jgi:hypothetical protein